MLIFFFFFSLSHSTDQITSAHICTRTIYFWVMRFSFSSRCCCWFVTLDQVHARWIMLPCFFLQKFRSCSLEMICECRCIWQKLDHIIHDAFATLCRHYMWIIKTPLQVWRMTWRWLLWLTCVWWLMRHSAVCDSWVIEVMSIFAANAKDWFESLKLKSGIYLFILSWFCCIHRHLAV